MHIWIYFRRNKKSQRVRECNEFCCWYWVAAQMDLSSCFCWLMLMHVHWKESVIHNICTKICIIVGTRVTLVLGLQKYSLLVLFCVIKALLFFLLIEYLYFRAALLRPFPTDFFSFFCNLDIFLFIHLFKLENMPPKFNRNQI